MRSKAQDRYITGPFFVILGGASLLYGAGILPLGARGWLWIGVVLIVGAALLMIVPERIWGRYSHSCPERCC